MKSPLHAPAANRATFDEAEDHAFDQQPDDDDDEQAGEHRERFQLVAVLVNEPADAGDLIA
jgi:hypothetical protein